MKKLIEKIQNKIKNPKNIYEKLMSLISLVIMIIWVLVLIVFTIVMRALMVTLEELYRWRWLWLFILMVGLLLWFGLEDIIGYFMEGVREVE